MNLLKFLEPKPDTSVTRQIWKRDSEKTIDELIEEVKIARDAAIEYNQSIKEEFLKTVTVEQIHEDFSTEVNRLLAEAGIKVETDHLDMELIDRARRMRNLGFGNTSTVKEAQKTEEELMEIERVNKEKDELREAIEYFTFKYPSYKFITEQSVKTICQKYGLIYGPVDRYIGDVPEKNLKEIEAFSISDEDEAWYIEWLDYSYRYEAKRFKMFGTKSKVDEISSGLGEYCSLRGGGIAPLEIAAPVKDFNLDGMHVEDFQLKHNKIEIPDPIVLKPVIYKGKDYRLIVTMWGDEANDPLVQNPRNN